MRIKNMSIDMLLTNANCRILHALLYEFFDDNGVH